MWNLLAEPAVWHPAIVALLHRCIGLTYVLPLVRAITPCLALSFSSAFGSHCPSLSAWCPPSAARGAFAGGCSQPNPSRMSPSCCLVAGSCSTEGSSGGLGPAPMRALALNMALAGRLGSQGAEGHQLRRIQVQLASHLYPPGSSSHCIICYLATSIVLTTPS